MIQRVTTLVFARLILSSHRILQPKSCLVAHFEYFNSLFILGKCITRGFFLKTGPRMCAGRHDVSDVVLLSRKQGIFF